MATSSPLVRLLDILEAIDLLRSEMAGVERGIEIISEASRRLPDPIKERHPLIPWNKVVRIGNILRHDYQHVAHDILWCVVQDELPPLEAVCRAELARPEDDRDSQSSGAA